MVFDDWTQSVPSSLLFCILYSKRKQGKTLLKMVMKLNLVHLHYYFFLVIVMLGAEMLRAQVDTCSRTIWCFVLFGLKSE